MAEILRGPQGAPKRSFEEFQPFSPTHWEGRPPPQHDWIVDGCFLRGTVAILAGDGGLGKSLLCQQLLTAAATGQDWLGLRTQRCRSLAVFCEDDRDELHRRQEDINRHYNCEMHHLEPVLIESRAGRDCVLMNFDRWGAKAEESPMFAQVRHAARQHKAQIVVLDTLADIFNGNEVDRNQPRTFIRALRKLALEIQGVVIVTQHPSVEGMASGTGRSGSTGWNNSVRSRLYLTMPKRKADEAELPTNERWLKTMKNNQGKFGNKIQLEWRRGVFVRQEEAPLGYNPGLYDGRAS